MGSSTFLAALFGLKNPFNAPVSLTLVRFGQVFSQLDNFICAETARQPVEDPS